MFREINYLFKKSSLDWILFAANEQAIVTVLIGSNKVQMLKAMQKLYPKIKFQTKFPGTLLQLINNNERKQPLSLPYVLHGTTFQKLVWQQIAKIPLGSSTTYSYIANQIGKPNSIRAVANAASANPLPLIIPCHRVLPKKGGIGGYRYFSWRKKLLLDLESQKKCYLDTFID